MKSKFNLIYLKIMRNIIKRLTYIRDNGPNFTNNVLNVLQSDDDLKKCLLSTSGFGRELQKDINSIVGNNENFNNAIARHALDTKTAGIMQNPNPINVTFCNVKNLDLKNPIIGKIATQMKASKLTEDQLTNKILMQDEIANIENRLEKLKRPTNVKMLLIVMMKLLVLMK